MEVHHHAHTSRKKWTHYFWEFLMLFLAVFCGFLAENQREHMVEHNREKEFMKSMLEDLRTDSIKLTLMMEFFETVKSKYDSVNILLAPPVTVTALLRAYRIIAELDDIANFNYTNRTVSQLKNAGGFRIIRKQEVASGIADYDAFVINNFSHGQDDYQLFFHELEKLKRTVFDYEIINKMGRWGVGKLGSMDVSQFIRSPEWDNDSLLVSMISADQKNYRSEARTEAYSKLRNELAGNIRMIDYGPNYGFVVLINKASALIELIRKQYHLQ
ncbi:MAG TPA: hypothetical protein VFO37_02885 [Chitinophagaceae bacterium]|jgi:hypothetical protein|nr:hypothetical protein [Chitinophagaceae bacterium]